MITDGGNVSVGRPRSMGAVGLLLVVALAGCAEGPTVAYECKLIYSCGPDLYVTEVTLAEHEAQEAIDEWTDACIVVTRANLDACGYNLCGAICRGEP